MLETVTPPPREMPRTRVAPATSVDFAAYLLAASPPGVDFFAFRNKYPMDSPVIPNNQQLKETACNDFAPKNGLNAACSRVIQTCKIRDGKKRVCFADDLGFDLVSIRLLKESSDSPPLLRRHILANLALGEKASATDSSPTLVLNFSQPAADYLKFRESLDKNKVCLENVILRENVIEGTIKVVNLAFNKKVILRYTVDEWSSHTDICASYVHTGQSGPSNIYDTFSFEFELPKELNNNAKVLFCICYEVDNQHYWDNNDSKNYEILPAEIPSVQMNMSRLTISEEISSWSEFSAWSNMDTSVPYW